LGHIDIDIPEADFHLFHYHLISLADRLLILGASGGLSFPFRLAFPRHVSIQPQLLANSRSSIHPPRVLAKLLLLS
jgi:hypothetical protein